MAAWGCGPCPVTGRPSGTSDCSRRQNNARRAARAPRAAPQRPARGTPALFQQAGPEQGPPALCCCLPPCCLLQPEWHWLLLPCGTARLTWGCTEPSTGSSTFLPPPRLVQPSCPREGGRGREGSRSDGACQVLGHGPGHGHQPCAPGGFKPLPVPREAAPTLPIHTMRLLSLLLLLGLCCLWARLVSPGECGWAQGGTGGCRSQWNHAAGGCAAMGTETTVTMAGSAASHLCCLPYIFACCRNDHQTPQSSLGELPGVSGALTLRVPLWGCQMCPVMLQSEGLNTDSCLSQNSPSPHLDPDQGPSLCSQPAPDSQTTAGQLDSQPWRAPSAAG